MKLLSGIVIAGLIGTSATASPMTPSEKSTARSRAWGFGSCLSDQKVESKKLLATIPGSEEEAKSAKAFFGQQCLVWGEKVDYRPNQIRGAVAEGLVKDNKVQSFGQPFIMPEMTELTKLPIEQQVMLALVSFGQCVSEKDGQAVNKLLWTDRDSSNEKAAFKALSESMNGCAVEGVNFNVDRLTMRGYLAEGAYRASALKREGLN